MTDAAVLKTFLLEPIACALCGPAPSKVLFEQRLDIDSFNAYAFSARRARKRMHYRIVVCKQCGLIRSDPVLDRASIEALYTESVFLFKEEEKYAAITYAGLIERLLPEIGGVEKNRRLLEIGCSTGFFLREAVRMGLNQSLGFEPSLECVRHAAPEVRPFIVNDVYHPEAVQDRIFDLVVSFHVFDHLVDPVGLLESAVSRLRPGGHVLLVCHDAQALSAKILGSHSPIFDVEHIFLFSQKTIGQLLNKVGLDIVKTGPLKNRYPLGYWLRMAPFINQWAGFLPKSLSEMAVTLSAGNLFAIGRKQD